MGLRLKPAEPLSVLWSPSQNKVSRDPSSYVKLSVGKKTYTSKVSLE
jgi:hypothetical protein